MRATRLFTALVSALVVVASAPAVATAQPVALPARPAPHAVTLVTGDTVTPTAVGGRRAASVSPGQGREAISYSTVEKDGDLYVIPDDAQRLLAADRLDRELFNVSRLVRDGYDDGSVEDLPLIVDYADRARPAPKAARTTLSLGSIGAVAVAADKSRAEAFWADIAPAGTTRGTGPAALDDGIAKVWLDAKATASLDVSVPQIGAPQMWQAGYDGTGVKVAVLDTGVDAGHPDLADEIVAAQSFVPEETVADGHGHGTHVAATIAGSGDGAGGAFKGVAPGADLMVGKVLANSGSGQSSWIIAGMEWAAASGADIISMSLGGTAYESSDPLSQAVDRLSASSGALFVIAAGNDGPGEQTIGSPGIADSALTVGAVSKTEVLASFSSRGPRIGDYAVKPEITAPGVGIVAARAAGTSLGTPVNDLYTSAGGTSMATPHVAGAAAIVAQAHPDWTGQQVKAALSSTAEHNPAYTPFQQGNGRVDVPRAVTQAVFGTPALSYGLIRFDAAGAVTKELSYTNETSAPVTLDLSSSLPAGALALSAQQLTVPAHGTASVTASVDSGAVAVGRYAGYVTASDAAGAITIRTAVGYEKESERYNLKVNYLDRNGAPADWVLFSMLELGGAVAEYGWTADADTFRVAPGTYSLGTWISTLDGAGNEISTSVVGDPQITVDGDTTITLDARKAVRIKPVTEHRDVEHQGITTSWRRGRTGASDYSMTRVQGAWGGLEHVYAAPTERVTDGFFDFYSKFHLLATELTAKVTSPQRITLAPEYTNTYSGWQPKFTGSRRVQLVAAGNGSAEAFKGLDVRGKAVLVALEPTEWAHDAVVNAAAAGAGYVLAYRKTPGKWFTAVNHTTVPAMTVSGAEGARLQSLLAAKGGGVRLELGGTAISPYLYELVFPETGRIPSNLTYRIDRRNTEKVITRYHDSGRGEAIGREHRYTFRPYEWSALGVFHYLALGRVRTEYYSAGDTTYLHDVAGEWSGGGEVTGPYVTRRPGRTSAEDWLSQVVRPATAADYGATTRTGNRLTVQIPEYADAAAGHHGYADTRTDTVTTRLSANGTLVGQLATWAWGTFTVPAEDAAYSLTVEATRQAAWAAYSTQTRTEWSFRSSQTTEKQVIPLLSVDYDLDLDLRNRTDDQRRFSFGLRARQQEGSTAAAIAAMKAWASYDDGGSWTPIEVRRDRQGGYRAEVRHPRLAATNGFVALRVEATDANGNKIDQTVKRAYGLK